MHAGYYRRNGILAFSLTVDYFDIKIDNIIGRVGVQNIVTACYDFGQFCNQIERAATGEFQRFIDTNLNAAQQTQRGVDVGANLRLPLGLSLMGGTTSSLDFRFAGTYTLESTYIPVPGLPIVNECAGRFGRNCGQPTPEWKHSLRTTFSDGPALISVLWRYIGSTTDDDPAITYGLERYPGTSYFDLSLGFDVSDNMNLVFNVANLLNKGFVPGASTQQLGNVQQSNTYPGTYDVLGRYYTVSARLRF